MVSHEARQKPAIAAATVLLAAAAPCPASSQPLLEPAARDYHRTIAEKIENEQTLNGPYSADLIDPLTTLGLLYQEGADHDLAAAALERALQVVRANYGLHSLDQAPLIRQSMYNEDARGNAAGAWELEQSLLALAKRHPDDLRTVSIFREIGDRRMNLLRRYLSGERPEEIIIGCFYRPEQYAEDVGSCSSGSRRVAARSILVAAWNNYAAAIDVFLRHELYSSDELRRLEMQLLRLSYQGGSYSGGKRSLTRLLGYDVANGAPWLTRIESLVRIADWDLLFAGSRNERELALAIYEHAYEQLLQKSIERASIEEIFSPATPVVLPEFAPNPLVANSVEESTGFIDVSFQITAHGKARNVEILTVTDNVTTRAKKSLVTRISRSRYRPRITDGAFVDTPPIVVRYHLNE